MRIILLGTLATVISPASLPIGLDLTGIWTLDSVRSKASIVRGWKSLTIDIEQTRDRIHVVWLAHSERGRDLWVEDLVSRREGPRITTTAVEAVAVHPQETVWPLQPSSGMLNTPVSNFLLWTISVDGSVLVLRQNEQRTVSTLQEALVFNRTTDTLE
jgi:hypothetical protein